MKWIFKITRIFLLFLSIMHVNYVRSGKTFQVSFQPNIEGPSSAKNDAWIEFTNKIIASKDFTICHWIKIKFYNFKYAACLWSYCTIKTSGDKMKCLRICLDQRVHSKEVI